MEQKGNSSNVPKAKKRRLWLSIDEKLRVIEKLDSGEKKAIISRTLGIPSSTIHNIERERERIFKLKETLDNQQGNSGTKRKNNQIEESQFEKILYSWYQQNRAAGLPISGTEIKAQALALNNALNGSSDFKASNGWLAKFKSRHGLGQLSVQGEKLSADKDESASFCESLKKIIIDEGYSLEHIYNADETGLMWRAFPGKNEMRVEDMTLAKERITLMVCANASGTQRLPLFCIGKSKKAPCFEHADTLPVVYVNQRNSWMDKKLFIQWYKEVFLPAAKSRLNPNENILLLLDNAPSHPPIEVLNAIDPSCRVVYLPPNITSLIQPMDQGVIVALKRLYKANFLRELLLTDADMIEKITIFKKKWNLISCFQAISAAWNQVTEATLLHSWNNILGKGNVHQTDSIASNVSEIQGLLKRVLQREVSSSEVIDWMNNDSYDSGWAVQSAVEMVENEYADVKAELSDNESEEDEEQSDEEQTFISAQEAYNSLCKVYTWMSRQRDIDPQKLSTIAELKMNVGKMVLDS